MRAYSKVFGAVLCTGMLYAASPAFAGFEFSPAAPSSAAKLNSVQSPDAEIMPAVPTGEVSMEPISGQGALDDSAAVPMPDQAALAAPTAQPSASSTEGVYIRRQKSVAITPAANEAINTSVLLKATTDKQPVSLAPQTMEDLQQVPAENQALIINPYPLGNGNAVHNNQGALPVEQAMMEEGGMLRPVATPGQPGIKRQRQAALSDRANTVSRAADVPLGPAIPFQDGMVGNSAVITPIPGGEGTPLNLSGREPPAATMAPVSTIPMTPEPPSVVPAGMKMTPRAPSNPAVVPPAPNSMDVAAMDQPVSTMPQKLNTAPAMATTMQPVAQPVRTAPSAPLISARTSSSTEGEIYYPPVTVGPRPVPVQARPPVQAAPAAGYTEAVGFGRDLPLALALSQIVPPDYSFSFAQDVDVGQTVSWQGGKPWNSVLSEMLAPKGMRAAIQNNQVTIVNGRS